MQPAPILTSAAALDATLATLAQADFLVLDTEFLRESTYFARLCLIQIATGEQRALIDPLALEDLSALWALLAERSRPKVLHAARQDVEVLSQAMRAAPFGPIFDTQVAAAMLGHPAQVGYATLVSELLGVTLDKGHTRTDWSRRPLSEQQLRYAEDDVRYLVPLYQRLQDELEQAGRAHWFAEEMALLEDPALYRTEPADAWKRLKGLERLQPAQRATAKLLAQWREQTAIDRDKPRGWILADETLRELAERLPESTEQLSELRTLPEGLLRRRGDELLALITQGQALADGEAAAWQPPRPEPEQLALVNKLMKFTRSHAQQLSISPELLATRKDVERLVYAGRTGHLLRGWRREVIGVALVEQAGVPVEADTPLSDASAG